MLVIIKIINNIAFNISKNIYWNYDPLIEQLANLFAYFGVVFPVDFQ